MKQCEGCNGTGFDRSYANGSMSRCPRCLLEPFIGFILSDSDKKEIKMNKAVDDAWEKNHE